MSAPTASSAERGAFEHYLDQWQMNHHAGQGTQPDMWELWQAGRAALRADYGHQRKGLPRTEESLEGWLARQPSQPTVAEIYEAGMQAQRWRDMLGGCACDPEGSGENYCTGHCSLRAEVARWRNLAMEAYGSIERGDLSILRPSLLSGFWYRLAAAAHAHLDRAVAQAVREEEGTDGEH